MPSLNKCIFEEGGKVIATKPIHPKLARHKLEMAKKREPIPKEEEGAPYQSESNRRSTLSHA